MRVLRVVDRDLQKSSTFPWHALINAEASVVAALSLIFNLSNTFVISSLSIRFLGAVKETKPLVEQ